MRTIGSLTLCRSLLKAELVDRFRVGVFPVITGSSGRERIYDGYPDVALDMISSRTFDGRIQLLEYFRRFWPVRPRPRHSTPDNELAQVEAVRSASVALRFNSSITPFGDTARVGVTDAGAQRPSSHRPPIEAESLTYVRRGNEKPFGRASTRWAMRSRNRMSGRVSVSACGGQRAAACSADRGRACRVRRNRARVPNW